MCLIDESPIERLTKGKIFWKVFNKFNNHLHSIHDPKRLPIKTKYLSSKKEFSSRFGFQVFETEAEAVTYSQSFCYPDDKIVKKVRARKGALITHGIIGSGYLCSGEPALRVSSLIIQDFNPRGGESL